MSQLDKEELELLMTTKLVEIEHKCDNFLPILIRPDVQAAIDLLLDLRQVAEVDEGNPHVFAAKRGSLNSVRGSQIIRSYREAIAITKPENITATGLRKHAATSTQVLDLTEGDRDNFARHLGHDIRVHRKFYQLNQKAANVIQMGK